MARFGDFEKPNSLKKSVKIPEVSDKIISRNESCFGTLKERIISHVASSDATVKSQQRGEPDLTNEERKLIISECLDKNPGQFLYRFNSKLENEHLQFFTQFHGDVEVDYYLEQTQKLLNKHTSLKKIKNRRYAALQRLRKGEYFSEESMRQREPLMYEQLVASYINPNQSTNQQKTTNDEIKFSTLLFNQMDSQAEQNLKKHQEEIEDNMFEENDSDEEQEEEEDQDENNQDVEMIEYNYKEKSLMYEEFISFMHNQFLEGKDKDFDYNLVDFCEEYDLLDIEDRDGEELYFNSEEPDV